MSTYWSENVQGPETLYLSRIARFSDLKKDVILNTLKLESGMKILEVGCGPGALSIQFARWLGNDTEIIGLDRDENFVKFARNKSKELSLNNIKFIEGDALNLPFSDNEFDVCFSHTVLEHVPNLEFLKEQKRVCKPGARTIVMNVRTDKSISISSKISELSHREKELWKPIDKAYDEAEKDTDVGKYEIDPKELPFLLEEAGFDNINIDALALTVVIDNSNNNRYANIILDSEHRMWLEALEIGMSKLSHELSKSHIEELRKLIDERFHKRKDKYNKGEKLWDYKIRMVLIGTGYKKI